MYGHIRLLSGTLSVRAKSEEAGPYSVVQGGDTGMEVVKFGREGTGVEVAGSWLQREAYRKAEVVFKVLAARTKNSLVQDVRDVSKLVQNFSPRWGTKIVYPLFVEHISSEFLKVLNKRRQ